MNQQTETVNVVKELALPFYAVRPTMDVDEYHILQLMPNDEGQMEHQLTMLPDGGPEENKTPNLYFIVTGEKLASRLKQLLDFESLYTRDMKDLAFKIILAQLYLDMGIEEDEPGNFITPAAVEGDNQEWKDADRAAWNVDIGGVTNLAILERQWRLLIEGTHVAELGRNGGMSVSEAYDLPPNGQSFFGSWDSTLGTPPAE